MRAELTASGLALASTTVATLLRILLDKGLLRVVDPQRPQRYEPVRQRDGLARRMLDQFIDWVFNGSQVDTVMRLVGSERPSDRTRARLRALLEELGEEPDEPGRDDPAASDEVASTEEPTSTSGTLTPPNRRGQRL